MNVTPTSVSLGSAGAPADGQSNDDKTMFMELLVAQLSNQDPMNPTDATEFVSQLAQFTELEQMTGLRESMDLMAVSQAASTSAQMVGFVGKEVEYEGDSVLRQGNGPSTLNYSLPRDASAVTVTVRNAMGAVVRTETLEGDRFEEGLQSWEWNGLDDDFRPVGDGAYTYSVEATDASGRTIDVSTRAVGFVAGVRFEGGVAQLVLDDGRILPLSDVVEIREPGAAGGSGGAGDGAGAGGAGDLPSMPDTVSEVTQDAVPLPGAGGDPLGLGARLDSEFMRQKMSPQFRGSTEHTPLDPLDPSNPRRGGHAPAGESSDATRWDPRTDARRPARTPARDRRWAADTPWGGDG